MLLPLPQGCRHMKGPSSLRRFLFFTENLVICMSYTCSLREDRQVAFQHWRSEKKNHQFQLPISLTHSLALWCVCVCVFLCGSAIGDTLNCLVLQSSSWIWEFVESVTSKTGESLQKWSCSSTVDVSPFSETAAITTIFTHRRYVLKRTIDPP